MMMVFQLIFTLTTSLAVGIVLTRIGFSKHVNPVVPVQIKKDLPGKIQVKEDGS